jgi:hypothetical protein
MTHLNDLLNFDDFSVLFSGFPNDIADTLSKNMLKYCFIKNEYNNEYFYHLQKNITYTKTNNFKKTLITIITKLIDKSFKALDNTSQENIRLKHKDYMKVFQNASVEKYLPQLEDRLKKDDIKIDDYECEIHFNNGYMDLRDLVFKQRDQSKHFITFCIPRDYKPSTEEERKEVMQPIKKIYPKDDDFKRVSLSLGSALSGITIFCFFAK